MAIRVKLRPVVAEYEKQNEIRLTYRALAEGADIGLSTVSAMMTKNQKRVDLDVLDRLCKFFNCSPGDILVSDH